MNNENEYQEPEEKELNQSNEPDFIDDFNPLDEAIAEKEYTKPNVRLNEKDISNPIPEPSFTPPPLTEPLSQEQKVKKPEEPFNPQMNNLSKKDKHDAAEKVSKMIMSAYRFSNDYVDKLLLFNERKIAKMQQEGEIDLSVEIPISASVSMTAGEFIQDYNDQSVGTIKVSKEFEEEVTPILTRVLEKKGIGMTDEHYLIYLFGKDIVTKGFLVYQSLAVKKDILNQLKEATLLIRGTQVNQPIAPPFNPSPNVSNSGVTFDMEDYGMEYDDDYVEPKRTKKKKREEREEYEEPTFKEPNVNDIVNQMTGGDVEENKFSVDVDSEDDIFNLDEDDFTFEDDQTQLVDWEENKSTDEVTNDEEQTKSEVVEDIEEPKYEQPSVILKTEKVTKESLSEVVKGKGKRGRPSKNKK